MKMKKWLKCLLMAMTLMAVVNVGTVSTTIPVAAKSAAESVKVGKKFWSGKFQYKVTSLKGKEGTASLIGTKSRNLASVNVPETVKTGNCILTVNAIGDGAFKNCKKLKKVATNTSISKIGKNAFSGCTKLTAVNIRSAALKSVGKGAIPKQAVVTTLASAPAQSTAAAAPASAVPAAAPAEVVSASARETESVPQSTETTAKASASIGQTEKKAATCGKKHLGLVVVESVAPTCWAEGQSSYEYCTVCGYATQPIPLSKVPHEMVLQPGQEATCTRQGWEAYNACRNCGYHEQIHYVPAKGHSYGDWAQTVPPTCTSAGSRQRTCTSCGARQTGIVPATGHSFGGWEKKQAEGTACYDVYFQTRSCQYCGATEKGNISTVHKTEVLEKKSDVEPTCTQPGKTNRTYCPNCKQEFFSYVKPLGHDFCTEPIIEEATCVKDGISYRKCKRCDATTDVKTIANPTGHTWEPYEVPATCTDEGFKGEKCSLCQETKGSKIARKAHDYETTIVNPTCIETGLEIQKCRVCHTTVRKVLPAGNGHNWISYPQEEATCAKAGHTAYIQCSKCGQYDGAQPSEIPKKEHTWMTVDIRNIVHKPDVTTDPQCELTEFVKCGGCGAYKIIPRKGHVEGGCSFASNSSASIMWMAFITADGFASVQMPNQCSRVWWNGGDYDCYVPALRSDCGPFTMPVPKAPAGKSFKGWQQVIGDTQVSDLLNAEHTFDGSDTGKTFIAVFE